MPQKGYLTEPIADPGSVAASNTYMRGQASFIELNFAKWTAIFRKCSGCNLFRTSFWTIFLRYSFDSSFLVVHFKSRSRYFLSLLLKAIMYLWRTRFKKLHRT